MNEITLSVKQLNTYVKNLVESDVRLSNISLCGEISNFKNHYSSGHWYFSLKDSDAQIRCVMFNSFARNVLFDVSDGMRVVLKGRVSIYERDGQYQFYAEEMHHEGEGDLAVAFIKLKEKLEKEGLFSPENKRPLKSFPNKIAVITSDTGAAVRDILNITSKRYPLCKILLCPVAVQGENAVGSMINMLERVYARDDIDTIIIGRGGGSIEDLWCFNNEELARKIYESPIPVISAVGHETDFTICDFVADVRASTPSHAAELAVPDVRFLHNSLLDYQKKFKSILSSKYALSKAQFDIAKQNRYLMSPKLYFDELILKIDSLTDSIYSLYNNKISGCENRLSSVLTSLDALSPVKTLLRGYAVVTAENKQIKSISDLQVKQDIKLKFADGQADCRVLGIKE